MTSSTIEDDDDDDNEVEEEEAGFSKSDAAIVAVGNVYVTVVLCMSALLW
jgi:hypothetical protein